MPAAHDVLQRLLMESVRPHASIKSTISPTDGSRAAAPAASTAIRMIWTALPITSARPSRLGYLSASGLALLGALGALLLACDSLFRIGLDAGALLIGLREAALGFRDCLAIREGGFLASLVAVFAMGHARSYGTCRSANRWDTKSVR